MNKTQSKNTVHDHFRDILEVASYLSTSAVPDTVIEMVLTYLRERLGKRARCAFLEGEDLKLRYWAGEYLCPINGLQVNKDSVVWDVVKKGVAVNLTDPALANGYAHTLSEPIRMKTIIPLSYSDPMTQELKKMGALIVDSGKEETPISEEDFAYLQVIGRLLGAIMGRAELINQLMASCSRQEEILMETAHNFRNRIVVIGGLSRSITKLAKGTKLEEKASKLHSEVRALEKHLADFERYMPLKG